MRTYPRHLHPGDIVHVGAGPLFVIESIEHAPEAYSWNLRVRYLLSGRRKRVRVHHGHAIFKMKPEAVRGELEVALDRLKRELIRAMT